MDFRISSRIQQGIERGRKTAARRPILEGSDLIHLDGTRLGKELIPFEAIREAYGQALAPDNEIQSAAATSCEPLHEQLRTRLASAQQRIQPGQLLLAHHTGQALELAVRTLTEAGDCILAEEAADPFTLQLLRLNGVDVLAVPYDEEGISLTELAGLIHSCKPKLIYVNPGFSATVGRTWSMKRRKAFVRLCTEHKLPIVEEDQSGTLHGGYKGKAPSLLSLTGFIEDSPVIHIGSFSHVIAPVLSTAWVIGNIGVLSAMAVVQQAFSRQASVLDQMALHALLELFDVDAQLRRVEAICEQRLRLITDLLERKGLPDVTWQIPNGGRFLWIELPQGLDGHALQRAGEIEGVAFDPGAPFFLLNGMPNTVRLNVAWASEAQLQLGMERFMTAIEAFLARA
ncbi:2-aminoadipate transaminase [Paenibacillus phyllosphaerae]|uniref:2-aminoadipate transaminase n=1 Tax=Paenibacillus phyllosphaerae TaxID=274593 RepID=A0A7W5FKN3_9BACL|nr:PLP-dependent aminotransferase family protein [Paenibacillus phyllosphaerae]MBB3108355.1 2-aminoadipate transaminase [Paenibacillus phyllosphaerae]